MCRSAEGKGLYYQEINIEKCEELAMRQLFFRGGFPSEIYFVFSTAIHPPPVIPPGSITVLDAEKHGIVVAKIRTAHNSLRSDRFAVDLIFTL